MNDELPRDYLPLLAYSSGSDVGLRREENQDSHGLLESELFRCFFVADGMGGAQGGAEASQLALATIRGFLAGEISLNVEGVSKAVQAANKAIFERSLTDPGLTGMGTTLVGLGFGREGILVCNVGDSRAFRIRRGKIGQMTRDHTLVQELVEAGTLTEEQAERHPVAHMLTRSLGPTENVTVDCWMYQEKPELGDVYVLCSDGLYNLVDTCEVAEAVIFNDGDDAVTHLIELANEAGGTDNITVSVIRVGPTTRVPAAEIAVERIPHRPMADEPESMIEAEEGGLSGPDARQSAETPSDSEDVTERRGSGAFQVLSGAFQTPELWRVRTALRDARNVVIVGGMGFLILASAWLLAPIPAPIAPLQEEAKATSNLDVEGALVSAALRANIPAYRERRRAEFQGDLGLIEQLISLRQSDGSSSALSEKLIAFRTGEQRNRTAVSQLLRDIAGLLDARDNLPRSPATLLVFSEAFEATSDDVKAAREAASGPIWRLRQTVTSVIEKPELAAERQELEKEVEVLTKRLQDALSRELSRRIVDNIQAIRSNLGWAFTGRHWGNLIERVMKGNVESGFSLEKYRDEVAAQLARIPDNR